MSVPQHSYARKKQEKNQNAITDAKLGPSQIELFSLILIVEEVKYISDTEM